jgi:acetyltransferase-like isoleucine patch superfamily enzyme
MMALLESAKLGPADRMKKSPLGDWLLKVSQRSSRLTPWCLNQALRLEGGQFYSVTARNIMRERYGVSIGAYSYGPCFDPTAFGAGTVIGRYVSIASGVRAYQANHPLDRLSTHPFFFNSELGYVPATNVPLSLLVVEDDVWIGESVIMTPRCRRIGLGVVIGAGSIVTKDVPDFAIVAGNPAKVIKWRFTSEMQECIRNSRWWELPVGECAHHIDFMSSALAADASRHPLLSNCCGNNVSLAKANDDVAISTR